MGSNSSIENTFKSADCPSEQLLPDLQQRQAELKIPNEHFRNVLIQHEESLNHHAEPERYYADLFNNAPVGYLTLTDKGLISEVNLTAIKLLGSDRQNLLSLSFASLVTAQDRDQWHFHYQELKNHNQQCNITLSLRRGDGTEVSVRLDCLSINSTLRISLIDVTTTKQLTTHATSTDLLLTGEKFPNESLTRQQNMTEQTLEQAHQLLKLAMISGQVGIWQYNLQTNEVIWDDIMFALYGADRKDFSGAYNEWTDRLHPDDRAVTEAALQDAISGKKNYNPEFRVIWANGEVHHIKGHAYVITDKEGIPQHIVGTNWDNSAFAQIHEQLLLARIAINNSNSAFIWLNSDGHVADTNDFACISLGYTPNELIGLHASDFDAGMSTESWSDVWKQLKKSGKYQGESFHRRKNGTVFPVEISTDFIVINGNEYSFSFIKDISERKQLEKNLIDSHAFNLKIINSLTSYIVVLDTEGNIITANKAFREFGKQNSLSEAHMTMLGLNCTTTCKNCAGQGCIEQDNAAQIGIAEVMSGKRELFELEYQCKSMSQPYWFHLKAMLVQNSPDFVVISHDDITERKQLMEDLSVVKKRLELAVEFGELGVWDLDLIENTSWRSLGHDQIFGYTVAPINWNPEIAMRHVMPDDQDKFSHALSRALDTGKFLIECRIVHPDQSIHWIIARGRVLYNDQAQPIRMLGTVIDTTEHQHRKQKAKEHLDQLAHVTRLGLMGEMASGLSHEVNQPLAAITNYAQASLNLMKKENPDLVKLAEIAAKTQEQALRAGRIIHRMKEFCKSKAQQRVTTDINELINESVNLCNDQAKQNNIAVTLKLEDQLPFLQVDHIQIEQVLINLIRNGMDAIIGLPEKKKGEISIESYLTPNNEIQVRVKDNGSGIREDQQLKILMPFHTTKAEGMGMGLSISRSLIEAHNGTLSFNSQFGKGTSFYFTLPI